MNLGNQLRLHRTGFNTVAASLQFKQTPIVITEADPDGCAACPVTMNPEDAYRNSPAYGAYEVAMMKRTLELEARIGVNVRGVLTWAFLFNNSPFFAGYRALATNGIHLPVLNAFKLLGRLDGTRVPVTSSGSRTLDDILTNSVRQQADVDAMATRIGQQVQVLVWNYHDDLVAAVATPVHLAITVPASFGSRVMVNHLRVDDAHGDACTVWVAQGSPLSPTAAQISSMQQAMEPAPLAPAGTVDVAGGAVTLDFMLPRFGISLFTLGPVVAADASAGDGMPGIADSGAGIEHTCSLLGDGTIRCWGTNYVGQLGDGSTAGLSEVPKAVQGISGAQGLAVGGFHNCALLSDRTVKCWGRNQDGQVGNGDNTTDVRAPNLAVSGLGSVAAITAGGYHSCALMADSTVRCWGRNTRGQLTSG